MTSGDSVAATVRRFLDQPRRMLIGGQWADSRTGETLESVDPATGRPLATIPRGDAADVDRAETDHSMRLVREEIFGPVLVAMEWEDVDDLVAMANDTCYGLSAIRRLQAVRLGPGNGPRGT